MKRLFSILLVLLLIVVLGSLILSRKKTVVVPTPQSPTPVTTLAQSQSQFCDPKNLQAAISFEGAAGNIYGNATIKNTSKTQCEIIGDNFINATYSAKNVKVSQEGQMGPNTLFLAPDQTVYSQVHFPNGPQCSGGIKQTPVIFSYQISGTDSVTFSQTGNFPSTLTTCTTSSDITQLDVWSISLDPLH